MNFCRLQYEQIHDIIMDMEILNRIMKWLGIKNISKDSDETIELTREEYDSIKNLSGQFEGCGVKKELMEEFKKAIYGEGLKSYAVKECAKHVLQNEPEAIEKAIRAIIKAYSFYPLPIYVYELARYMELDGNFEEAQKAYKLFIEKTTDFKGNELSDIIQNIEETKWALEEAKRKIE
jgi:hypothetical protein